jgi:hypothetical protein
LKID